jgi:predicted GH43/DUF377 family glycosyl hydrolase
MALLDDNWQPLADSKIEVPKVHKNGNLEDPRIFSKDDGENFGTYLAWTEALYVENNWNCIQRYGRLMLGKNGFFIEQAFTPQYGKNDFQNKEKNWQFFFQRDRLFCIYSHRPQVVIELEGESVVNEWRTPGFFWGNGNASGGTPPVEYDEGHLISFFHAYVANTRHHRKYNFAALLIESKPPFAVTHISSCPLMVASEKEPLPEGENWNPLCVFPCGVIKEEHVWNVSLGVNDCRIAVAKIATSNLSLSPVKMDLNGKTTRILLNSCIGIGGIGRVAGSIVEVKNAVAMDLLARGRATLAPDPLINTIPEKTKPVKAVKKSVA